MEDCLEIAACPRRRQFFALCTMLLCCGVGSGAEVQAADGPKSWSLEILSERSVPDSIEWAMDVRWASDRSVMIAAGQAGVWEVPTQGSGPPEVVIGGSKESGGFWLASRLGRSATHLVVAPPLFSFAWRLAETSALRETPFDVVVDLDVFEDRLVILGGLKDMEGRYSPDGAIAWTGRLSDGSEGLKPIYYSIAGAGATPMAECAVLELGAARFLSDGSILVVPGVEPGIYWYDSSGNLVRTWESETFGLGGLCSANEGLAASPEVQYTFVNRRRMLDDILPLPAGPGLLLRDFAGGENRWHLKILHRNGSIGHVEIPITSSTGKAHLRGDVRGNRVALLVVEYGRHAPAAKPRLIIAELRE